MDNLNEKTIRFASEIPTGSEDDSDNSDDEFRLKIEPVLYRENMHTPSTNTGTQNECITPNIDQTFSEFSFDNNIFNGLEDLLPLEQITHEQPLPHESTQQNIRRSKTTTDNTQIQPPVLSYSNINWKNGNLVFDKNFT